jgi:predicted nucleic acid-binding protein
MSDPRKRLPRYVLDRGGLTALTGRSRAARDRLRFIAMYRGRIEVPAAILVECTTGDPGRDAEVNRVVKIVVETGRGFAVTDEQTARIAGQLRHRARTDDGIDALVAACAVGDGSPAVVLTSDPKDLQRLLSRSSNVTIRAV